MTCEKNEKRDAWLDSSVSTSSFGFGFISLLALTICLSGALHAGPNRASTVTPAHAGAANLDGKDKPAQPLSQGGGEPNGNYCSVTIGPGNCTWVRGVGQIIIFPTTTNYARTYELKGWDQMHRKASITGCEIGSWVYTATCWIRVTAEAARQKAHPGPMTALGAAELRVWEDGKLVASDMQECMVTGTSTQATYDPTDDRGNVWPAHGTMMPMVEVPNTAPLTVLKGVATSICLVTAGSTVKKKDFGLTYEEIARVYMNVGTTHGHSKVDVVHETYTVTNPDGSTTTTTNYWKVKMESFDNDDPQNPVSINQYFFDGARNE
jgi:hypothetical protein